jgi:hypothetical protein
MRYPSLAAAVYIDDIDLRVAVLATLIIEGEHVDRFRERPKADP